MYFSGVLTQFCAWCPGRYYNTRWVTKSGKTASAPQANSSYARTPGNGRWGRHFLSGQRQGPVNLSGLAGSGLKSLLRVWVLEILHTGKHRLGGEFPWHCLSLLFFFFPIQVVQRQEHRHIWPIDSQSILFQWKRMWCMPRDGRATNTYIKKFLMKKILDRGSVLLDRSLLRSRKPETRTKTGLG